MSKQEDEKKQGIKLTKLIGLSEDDLKKINLDDLWIMEPQEKVVETKVSLCGCRNVCHA